MDQDDDQYRWESGYERTWEVIQEDESGSIAAAVNAINQKNRRKELAQLPNVRLGMMRHLYVVLDMSDAMKDQDLRPNRLFCSIELLKEFIFMYFDSNPISQIGLIITRKKRSEKISELAGNPRSHVALLEQLKYQECEGEASIQNALEMGLQTLKHMPKYSSREMLFVLGCLTTCDPGNILKTLKMLSRSLFNLSKRVFLQRTMTTESPFKPTILQNQVALVTGGSSGIGLEICRELGKHGCSVVMMGRRAEMLTLAEKMLTDEGIRAFSVQGDVRIPEDGVRAVKSTVEKFGGLDCLINGAAGNFLCAAENLTPNGFKTVLDIDTQGTFNMCRAAFPQLRESSNANIINISTTFHYAAMWYQAHVCAAKAAVDALTRALALEWGEYGIRVNGIAPGPIADTAGFSKLGGSLMDTDSSENPLLEAIPLKRIGTKWDVAMSVLYLCSTAGQNITGSILVNDGGNWLYKPQILDRETVQSFSRSVEKKSRQAGIATKSKL
ncbi:unnamed protein product [Rotaria magnacalcarata]|uniref:Peroxisomal 2,4-dienoyl-CoA reductase [(3E)-enoyl-CoA-producing] n=6 Tax=Rotaria magnacalcarata TaxID=392030 RepID=A0A8S2LUS9_9BILA|nr:unnamed protein product [Rotaria magnacalcarata]